MFRLRERERYRSDVRTLGSWSRSLWASESGLAAGLSDSAGLSFMRWVWQTFLSLTHTPLSPLSLSPYSPPLRRAACDGHFQCLPLAVDVLQWNWVQRKIFSLTKGRKVMSVKHVLFLLWYLRYEHDALFRLYILPAYFCIFTNTIIPFSQFFLFLV